MTLPDIVANAAGNLWRMKLRSILTISGVVIAIAAFVSLLSFGVGMQKNVTEQFETLGLLSTLQVYPPRQEGVVDTTKARPVLNLAAVKHLATIPGVKLAYPYDDFKVTAIFGDSVVSTTAQALAQAAVNTRLYSKLRAGNSFSGDSSHQAMVTDDFLKDAGIKNPDSAIGMPIVVSTKVSTIDSALAHVFQGAGRRLWHRLSESWQDSLWEQGYWLTVGRDIAAEAMSRFMHGLIVAQASVTDTLIVSGVVEEPGHTRMGSIVIPAQTAARLNAGDFSDDPTSMLAMLRSGELLRPQQTEGSAREFPRVTLDLDPNAPYEPVRDSVKALGYRTFSYADEFNQMRKFFLYFKLGLTMVGIIALVTASLGIVNTMVMSILERTREIGVLKSLGADDSDIRRMFLVESGLMGTIGATLGIGFGWVITLIATEIAHSHMAKEGIPLFALFSFPVWLIGGAIAFGLLVSLGAGLYPSSRAARINPVEALRQE
jgi:ABC-type antimicrobial peptide transport system permease subunit